MRYRYCRKQNSQNINHDDVGIRESEIMEHKAQKCCPQQYGKAYEGISQDIDGVRIVLSQNYLSKSFLVPSQKEIDHYLVCELNLVRENNYFYGNDYVSITDVSAQGDNVLSNGKQLFFIDPIIKFNRPAIEVLDYYYSLLI